MGVRVAELVTISVLGEISFQSHTSHHMHRIVLQVKILFNVELELSIQIQ